MTEHPGAFQVFPFSGFLARVPLPEILNSEVWIAFPSGLSIPIQQYNAYWGLPGVKQTWDYRIGSADQALRVCRRWKIEPADVWTVPEEDIHGTVVLEASDDGSWWQMVQARSFPHWSGV